MLASIAPRHQHINTQDTYDLIEHISAHAWCLEFGRVVTSSEVWNLLHHDNDREHPSTFMCIDPNCRAKLILKNCQPYLIPEETKFRLAPCNSHHYLCQYYQEQRVLKKKLINQKKKALHHRFYS